MATTPSQKPVASELPQDLKFNAGKIDEFVTSLAQQYIDRLGGKHYTIEGLKQLALQQIYNLGWNPVGTFQGGATVANPGDIVQDTTDDTWYRWDDLATLPKTVSAGSIPGTAGGTGEGKWQPVDVSDVLRRELAAPGGAGMVGGIAKPVTWEGFAGGADQTGVADSFASFQAAVVQTEGQKIQLPIYVTVPVAPFITIHVPSGKYKLSAKISPKGKSVIWLCDAGVDFDNADNLCGRVIQAGVKNNSNSHGTLDSACGYSVSANRGLGRSAAVQGITSPADLRTVTERDTVGFYAENGSTPPTLTVATATYTSLTAIPSPAVDVSQLIPGMIVDTDNGFAGVLESFAADGSSITVKDGWYQSGAAGSSPQIPPAAGFKINAITKIWAMNAQSVLTVDGHATRSAGFELGLQNAKINLTDPASTTEYVWGYDTVGFGPFPASVGFIQRTGILRGFESSGASQEGFVATSRGGVTPISSFMSKCNAFQQFTAVPDGVNSCWKVINNGDMDIGGQTYAGNRTIRYRSSQLNSDYDTRTQSVGGTAAAGQGTFRITALHTEVSGSIRPVTANASLCGTASNYWSGGNTQSAFTVISDEREKTELLDITDKLLDAWSEVKFGQFKYLNRVEAKGEDGARWHFGVIAQRAKEAFERHGLDVHDFAFFCYDEWGDEFEDVQTNIGAFTIEMVKVEEPARVDTPAFLPDGTPLLDAAGKQIIITSTAMTEVWVESHTPDAPVFEKIQVRKAGSRYGIRYEEALVLEAELQRRNYHGLMARVEALEGRDK